MYSKRIMKKENVIIVILSIMIVSTAILLWFSFEPFKDLETKEKSIIPTNEHIGKQVYITGKILSIRKTFKGEHAVITIELKDFTSFPMFISKKNGAAEILENYKEGDKIKAKGKVKLYNEKLEIIIQRAEDIKKID